MPLWGYIRSDWGQWVPTIDMNFVPCTGGTTLVTACSVASSIHPFVFAVLAEPPDFLSSSRGNIRRSKISILPRMPLWGYIRTDWGQWVSTIDMHCLTCTGRTSPALCPFIPSSQPLVLAVFAEPPDILICTTSDISWSQISIFGWMKLQCQSRMRLAKRYSILCPHAYRCGIVTLVSWGSNLDLID